MGCITFHREQKEMIKKEIMDYTELILNKLHFAKGSSEELNLIGFRYHKTFSTPLKMCIM